MLSRCQYYLIRLGSTAKIHTYCDIGIAFGYKNGLSTIVQLISPIPTSMRNAPNITAYGTLRLLLFTETIIGKATFIDFELNTENINFSNIETSNNSISTTFTSIDITQDINGLSGFVDSYKAMQGYILLSCEL